MSKLKYKSATKQLHSIDSMEENEGYFESESNFVNQNQDDDSQVHQIVEVLEVDDKQISFEAPSQIEKPTVRNTGSRLNTSKIFELANVVQSRPKSKQNASSSDYHYHN